MVYPYRSFELGFSLCFANLIFPYKLAMSTDWKILPHFSLPPPKVKEKGIFIGILTTDTCKV